MRPHIQFPDMLCRAAKDFKIGLDGPPGYSLSATTPNGACEYFRGKESENRYSNAQLESDPSAILPDFSAKESRVLRQFRRLARSILCGPALRGRQLAWARSETSEAPYSLFEAPEAAAEAAALEAAEAEEAEKQAQASKREKAKKKKAREKERKEKKKELGDKGDDSDEVRVFVSSFVIH